MSDRPEQDAPSESFEFRPYTNDELGAFDALQRYVFGNTEPVPESGPQTTLQPEWSQCAFHDGSIVASSAAYPFIVRMNGPTVTMHGVTAVGTDPAYRRRGLVRRMITDPRRR
ncbi:MAG: GNAT family N-acetyltransferase [Pseudomonadota bacterium]